MFERGPSAQFAAYYEEGASILRAGHEPQASAPAAAFSAGAVVPLRVALAAPAWTTAVAMTASAVLSLAMPGGVGARGGGVEMLTPVVRVTLRGVLAMAITAGIGPLPGAIL